MRKMYIGKCSSICIWRVQRIPEERTNSSCGSPSRGCLQRVHFKLQMDLLIQYGVSLTLTWCVAGAPLGRRMVMQLGNWSSAPHQLTMGLPQGSLLLLVLFNIYTKGLADMNQNGPSKILTLADDGLIYKTSKDSQEAAEAVQQQLDTSNVMTPDLSSIQTRHKHCGAHLTTEQQANQCQQSHLMELRLNEQVIWDTLGSTLTECWPTENMWKQQHWSVRKVCQSWKLWLQRLYWTMPPLPTVSKCGAQFIDYGLGLRTTAQTNLLKVDRVQNKAM